MQSNEIIALLERKDVRSFIDKNLNEKPDILALKYKDKVDFDISKLTKLLHIYQKAQRKIPAWVANRCAISPKNYEQCTDARVAEFKASLFRGETGVDLTCGLGVDTYHFASRFKSFVAYESDHETFENVQYNFSKLGVNNVKLTEGSYDAEQTAEKFDFLYVDPDRRIDSSTQNRAIETWSPDVTQLYQNYLNQAKTVAIKVSPMLDLTYLIQTFKHLTNIYVIGLHNEVKELLLVLDGSYSGRPNIKAVDITTGGTFVFDTSEPEYQFNEIVAPTHIVEPSRAIIKANLAPAFFKHHQLMPFSPRGLYAFSSSPLDVENARVFEILESIDVNWKSIKKLLKTRGINQINIATRDFPEAVSQIRKRLQIPDGGTKILILSRVKEKTVCYLCNLPATKWT